MSKWLKTKKDLNHRDALSYLRACGYVVEELFDPLDLIVWDKQGWATFVEIKRPEANTSKWTREQLKFIVTTNAPVIIATSGENALMKIRDKQTVTLEQRLAVKNLLAKDDRKFLTEKDLREIL